MNDELRNNTAAGDSTLNNTVPGFNDLPRLLDKIDSWQLKLTAQNQAFEFEFQTLKHKLTFYG